MLLTLTYPLNEFFTLKNKISSDNYLLNINNFQLNKNFDERYIFFKFYKEMRKFNHEEQILLMLLNNFAQLLYLSNKLHYDKIISYSMKKLKIYKSNAYLNNIPSILKFIKSVKDRINND